MADAGGTDGPTDQTSPRSRCSTISAPTPDVSRLDLVDRFGHRHGAPQTCSSPVRASRHGTYRRQPSRAPRRSPLGVLDAGEHAIRSSSSGRSARSAESTTAVTSALPAAASSVRQCPTSPDAPVSNTCLAASDPATRVGRSAVGSTTGSARARWTRTRPVGRRAGPIALGPGHGWPREFAVGFIEQLHCGLGEPAPSSQADAYSVGTAWDSTKAA
jgi:hypothetical protein